MNIVIAEICNRCIQYCLLNWVYFRFPFNNFSIFAIFFETSQWQEFYFVKFSFGLFAAFLAFFECFIVSVFEEKISSNSICHLIVFFWKYFRLIFQWCHIFCEVLITFTDSRFFYSIRYCAQIFLLFVFPVCILTIKNKTKKLVKLLIFWKWHKEKFKKVF